MSQAAVLTMNFALLIRVMVTGNTSTDVEAITTVFKPVQPML